MNENYYICSLNILKIESKKWYKWCKSNIIPIISAGLTQVSRLGPLLFNIYINHITNIGLESEILIFAHDCTLIISDVDPSKTVTIML